MSTHKNARLTPYGRAHLVRRVVDEGLRPEEVTQAQGVSVSRVYKWVRRYREERTNPGRGSPAQSRSTPAPSGWMSRSIFRGAFHKHRCLISPDGWYE
ncbi:leucine zipper domain-containing protein [Halomonas stenophila]|uniref:Transposase-like protein n=1 Tax=Halomonas stenophila TaxID=795312 RepID=A0A7W5HN11_9GAMM|nr:transposase-like protein [Halomonas stenophila]